MKAEILKLLKETDAYVSGQELCEHFGVSRTAVWKVIKQLESEGYKIEAVRNKGYHLMDVYDILNKVELESAVDTKWAGRNVYYLDETDSTNNEAKRVAEAGAPHGTLVVADFQTGGRGRQGKAWVSARGTGIWMSLVLRPGLHPMKASMLTLVAAMAVADGLNKTSGMKSGIKWPNDIVIGGKKICGILTEMSTELEYINYVVTGIGINVNIEEFPEDTKAVATSLRMETGKLHNRSTIVCEVLKSYEKYYELFMEGCNMGHLTEEYNSLLVNKGNAVRVLLPGGEYTGVSLGINEEGELLVKMEDGQIRTVISGEVSVRGVYGYV